MIPPNPLPNDNSSSERKSQFISRKDEFNQAIIDTIGTIVIVTDTQGIVRFFNKTAENISGYTTEEIIGKFGFDVLISPDIRPKIIELLKLQKSTPLPRTGEGTLLTKGGDVRVISWIDNGIFNLEGDLEYLIFTGVDNTYRKEIEQQLIESKDNLEFEVAEKTFALLLQKHQIARILDALKNGIIVLDTKGNIINVNNRFRDFYRKSLDEEFPNGAANISSLRGNNPLIDTIREILQTPSEQSRTIEIKPDLILTLECDGQFIDDQQRTPIKVIELYDVPHGISPSPQF